MPTVAIGGFHQKIVGRCGSFGIQHQGIVEAANVARESDFFAVPPDQRGSGAQDVPGAHKPQRCAIRQSDVLVEGYWPEKIQRPPGVFFRVKRQCRIVPGKTMPVGVSRVLFLQMSGIGQQYPAQVGGGFGTEYGSAKTLFYQQRQIAGMIQMRMGQDDNGNIARRHRRRRPVAQAQSLVALEQPAIDKQAVPVIFEQIFGAGNRAGAAEKGKVDGHQGSPG
jgi:hypothetical protein